MKKIKKAFKWLRKHILNKETFIYLCIAEAIFWSPCIIVALLAVIINPWWWTVFAAICLFWSGPFTPAIPLQIALTLFIKKILTKRKNKNMSKTYFAVSDVHSFYTILIKSLEENGWEQDNPDHILILCGDAFDRGKESVQLFEFLKSLPKERLIYIKGNHEDLLQSCCESIEMGYVPSINHFYNGTINTICDICDVTRGEILNMDQRYYDFDLQHYINKQMSPLLTFIKETCVDYYQIKDKIFVHGWIPSDSIRNVFDETTYIYDSHWKKGNWERARWVNGMKAWSDGVKIDNKTIVCGHWDSWWGHKNINEENVENHNTFEQEGIICLDACTVKSKQINVYKFQV